MQSLANNFSSFPLLHSFHKCTSHRFLIFQYPILRELHKWETDSDQLTFIEDVVQSFLLDESTAAEHASAASCSALSNPVGNKAISSVSAGGNGSIQRYAPPRAVRLPVGLSPQYPLYVPRAEDIMTQTAALECDEQELFADGQIAALLD